jgi:DnaJ family protein C protein 11
LCPASAFSWNFSSVLNLPETASSEEVRERYRALSVLFHPDKQREESTKITASKRFLEIQKAYEGMTAGLMQR